VIRKQIVQRESIPKGSSMLSATSSRLDRAGKLLDAVRN